MRNDREVDVIQSDCGNPGLKDSGSPIKLRMTSYCGFPVKLRMTKKREEWIPAKAGMTGIDSVLRTE